MIPQRVPKTVRQSEPAECGLACLCIVSEAFGHDLDLRSVREKFSPSTRGLSLKDLSEIARSLQLNPRVLRIDLEQLKTLRLPAILHWELDHFIVIVAVGRKGATIIDPSVGRRRVSLNELDRAFTGIAMEFTKSTDFRKQVLRSRSISIGQLISVRAFMLPVLGIVFSSLLVQLVVLGQSALVADALGRSQTNTIGISGIIAVGLVSANALVPVVVRHIRSRYMNATGARMSLEITAGLVQGMLRTRLSWFSRRPTADTVDRVTSAAQIHRFLVGDGILAIIDVAVVFACICVAAIFKPGLAAVFVVALLAKVGISRLFAPRVRDGLEQQAHLNARQVGSLVDILRNIRTIKIACLEQQRFQDWVAKYTRLIGASAATARDQARYDSIDGCIDAALLIGVILYLFLYGPFAQWQEAVVVILLVQTVITSLSRLQKAYTGWLSTEVQWGRAQELLVSERDEAGVMLFSPTRECGGVEVRFHDVNFSYSSFEQSVVSNFTRILAPGSFTIITGPSGSGKSTLLKLLLRVETPLSGSITMNGGDIALMTSLEYARYVGAVLQDESLFVGTIRDNITMFDTRPDLEKIQTVCRIACIHDDILRMPMKYSTMVSSDDAYLSGGQMQRVVLARALYRGPRVLVLDEATSSLDEETEARVFDNLNNLGITRVVVTHRKSVMRFADEIINV